MVDRGRFQRVTEGDAASYTVSLAGTLQAGETATIDLALTDIDTTARTMTTS